ncbi:hypothetical protein ACSBR2_034352 [Camellia fascicularis]
MVQGGNGGWIPVVRQRRGGGAQGKEAKHGLFIVFMDNIPSAMDAKALFKLFTKFGIVKDAFIPFKRRKVTNSRFKFVRFDCHVAKVFAIQKVNGLLVDDMVLEVKIAAYDRNSKDEQSRIKPQPTRRSFDTTSIRGKALYVGHRSFAAVLKGDTLIEPGFHLLQERCVWLRYYGIPLNLWNRNTLNNIGSLWGPVLSLDGDICQPKSFSHPRIRVATLCIELINKTIILECKSSPHPILVYEDHLADLDSLKLIGMEDSSFIKTCYSNEDRCTTTTVVKKKKDGDEVAEMSAMFGADLACTNEVE